MAVEKFKMYCDKCGRLKNSDKYYSTNNLEKYPKGKVTVCKDCMTMHIDNFQPETYVWIMKEVDVPYVPDVWNKVLLNYKDQPDKLVGPTIMGRYMSQMKLSQYKNKHWADTQTLSEERKASARRSLKAQGYSDEEIEEEVKKMNIPDVAPPEEKETYSSFMAREPEVDMASEVAALQNMVAEMREQAQREAEAQDELDRLAELTKPSMQQPELETPEAPGQVAADPYGPSYFEDDLEEEDRKYLSLKWGRQYTAEEWVRLEQLYVDMFNSFDIQNAGHVDTLKLICKTSLKTHQLLDMGDVEGAKKTQAMYDSLMRSGKFTAQQNKTESGDDVDSVGELVAMCEKEGFIPRFCTDIPQDKVDKTLADLKQYTKTLITEELNLGNLIENAIRQMQKQDEFEKKLEDDEDVLIPETQELEDQDYEDFYEFLESEEEDDDE